MPVEKGSKEFQIIDIIRKNKDKSTVSISTISDKTNIPWSSVSNCIKKLEDQGIVIYSEEDKYTVNPKYEYYVGISLGTSKIKFVVLDYQFDFAEINYDIDYNEFDFESNDYNRTYLEKLKEEVKNNKNRVKVCYDLQFKSMSQFSTIISFFVDFVCYLKNKLKYNIVGIAFVLPGNIDFENQIISNSYVLGNVRSLEINIFLTRKNTEKLINNGISFCVDHNAKAAILAEKEIGENWNTKDRNLMCIYLGYGIGASFILNNKLYRGNRNESGQFGHNQIIPRNLDLSINSKTENNFCRCGRINCLEHRIRTDVFDGNSTLDEVIALLKKSLERRILFSKYIGEALCNVIDNLSIDNIIFTGKFASLFDLFESNLYEELLSNNLVNVKLGVSTLGEFSAAIGAAISVYYNK